MDDAERAMAEKIRTEVGEFPLLTDFSVIKAIAVGSGIIADSPCGEAGTTVGLLYLTDHFGVEQTFVFEPAAWECLRAGLEDEKLV